eukprot:TRINITY_DN7060_c0_g1_i11.p1 TRINITY_DN7060_c0_g1~~TRINITY_DN7060_c0_g1_i11.p1  ORF type:complete len:488 (-),score=60.78 TRINITY_DN7060_c0_g1_i11:196-1614(-)
MAKRIKGQSPKKSYGSELKMQGAWEGNRDVLSSVQRLVETFKERLQHPVSILGYAESELLLQYKERVDNFGKGIKTTEEIMKEFLASSVIVRKGLVKLRTKFENMIQIIDRSLELLGKGGVDLVVTKDLVKANVITQYEKFKEAVKSENLSYIIERLDKPCAPDISDGEKQLVEALKKTISDGIEKLNVFSDLLGEFNKKYQLLIKDRDTQDDYIYGNCNPQKSAAVLCRYSIRSKKLECLIDIPKACSIAHISGRIFLSGGECFTNLTKEYIEKSLTLVPKAPMTYFKRTHTIQIINKNLFAAVGGYNGNQMIYCEEYSISDDKWKEIPSLNKARCCTATVYLNNKLLYAIGGENTNGCIEALNYNEKKKWVVVKIMGSEVPCDYFPKAVAISNNEVFIFCGDHDGTTGIWDLKTNVIQSYKGSMLSDYYSRNQVCVRDRKGYVLGYHGHMHIFDLDTRKLTELKYSSILS